MLSTFPVIICAIFTASVAETDIVKKLADHLTRLESKVIGLEAREVQYKHNIQKLEKEVLRQGQVIANTSRENRLGLTETISNRQRRASELVAFTAYLSADFDGAHFGNGHTIKYDVIETNEGNGYNKFTGTFTAPLDGIYAFTWTIKAAGRIGNAKHGEITVELVKNSVVKGVINADSEQDYDDACSTALVILSLSAGDVLFTRSAPFEQPQGILSSDVSGRWTFSASIAESDTVKTLADRLTQLEAREENHQHEIQELRKEVSRLGKMVEQMSTANQFGLTETNSVRKRRQTEHVAFTAYLSNDFNGPYFGTGHTVKYDVIETNVGNGYNNFTGIFTAPSDGIYAFTWTIIAAGHTNNMNGEITIELVRNSDVRGVIDVDTENERDDAVSTAFVILFLSTGDVVFTRSAPFEHPQGILSSDKYGRWSFSGWRLF